jgi:TonB family protein
MKRHLILLILFFVETAGYSQIIDETIPKFCENIIILNNKESIKMNLLSKEFRILPINEMLEQGWVNNNTKNTTICGIGNYNILCKVSFNPQGSVSSVIVAGTTYLQLQNVFDEFTKTEYQYNGINNSGTYVFAKHTTEYIYVGMVDCKTQNGIVNTMIEIGRRPETVKVKPLSELEHQRKKENERICQEEEVRRQQEAISNLISKNETSNLQDRQEVSQNPKTKKDFSQTHYSDDFVNKYKLDKEYIKTNADKEFEAIWNTYLRTISDFLQQNINESTNAKIEKEIKQQKEDVKTYSAFLSVDCKMEWLDKTKELDYKIKEIERQQSKIFKELNSLENKGSGGFGTFNLNGRSIGDEGLPRPSYRGQEEGRIVMNITVDSNGDVIHVEFGRGTNIDNPNMRKSALDAAKRAKFNRIQGTNNQNGTITYIYKLM